MPEYVVERIDTEVQHWSFEAKDLTEAVLKFQAEVKQYSVFLSVSEWRTSSVYIDLRLPFGDAVTYLVGEVGRSD